MSTPPSRDELPVRRIDRILATMSLSLLALSLLCFAAIIIGTSSGAKFDEGMWPTIGVIVYIAPILAFAMLLSVVIMTFVRRARAGKGR